MSSAIARAASPRGSSGVARASRGWLGLAAVLVLGLVLGACPGSSSSSEDAPDDARVAAEAEAEPDAEPETPAKSPGSATSRAGSDSPEHPAPKIHVNQAGGQTFHHLALELRSDDLVLSGPLMDRDMAYQFSDGGQFEIYLRPEVVPATNPGCPEGLIVRMPWTNPKAPNARTAVEGKQALFSALVELREGRREQQRVILQLDPYVEVAPDDPTQVSLTQCTIFFRQAHDAYVDHLDSASP